MGDQPEITFLDAEYQTTSIQKIDFKQILFRQLDYIRFLRTQDMGELMLFGINIFDSSKTDTFYLWVSNNQKFQNAVKTLQSLMYNYWDEVYDEKIKKIEKIYQKKLVKSLQDLKQKCLKERIDKDEFERRKEHIIKNFNLVETTYKYDQIFEVTLELVYRAKFIGGNDYVEDWAFLPESKGEDMENIDIVEGENE